MIDNAKIISKYYEILECSEDATWPEIKKSYNALKELYSTHSLATIATGEDLLQDKGGEILDQINMAYRALDENFKKTRVKEGKDVEEITSRITIFNGPQLKNVRETLGIDLLDISIASNVQISHFRNIENEVYEELPTEIYLKGYLNSYAEYLSLDPHRVLDDYMRGLLEWREANTGTRDKSAYSFKKLLPSWFNTRLK